ncbi:hypothetical protein Y032_0101g3409 [Ancylostoma ceylanicum]|uniref:Uncharacterized protein n=1 Tax=Ancylostoma ceylanicum TaxID=53326 RepID=A0A016TH30_9BILA|nr:hypothetical protein Y032_0101g3409 [Ancylostoma ceylanicum]
MLLPYPSKSIAILVVDTSFDMYRLVADDGGGASDAPPQVGLCQIPCQSRHNNRNRFTARRGIHERGDALTYIKEHSVFTLGINQICPQNSGVNDKIRRKALEMHNWRRLSIN